MELAQRIDHTLLKAEADTTAVDRLCDEALEYGFASVCVNGRFVRQVADRLGDTAVRSCVVVGFPLGAGDPAVGGMEAIVACKQGAEEIDFVAHLPFLLACDLDKAREQFRLIVRSARDVRRETLVKVIIESACLMQDASADEAEARIACACQAAMESGCDFVKTSTGFHPAGGASEAAVALMVKHAPGLKVKASGGIRTRDDALRMINAGAERLGCSAGVQIVQGGKTDEAY